MTEENQGRPSGLISRIVRGGFWSLSGQGVTLLTSLLATPVTIRLLGTERYGVLALINLLVGYLSFADWGMGTASTRYAAAAHALKDDKGEATAIWAALVVSIVPVSLATGMLILAAPLLLQREMQVPLPLQHEATLALQVAALGVLGRAIGAVLNTPQLVRLKLRLNACITTAGNILQVGLMPLVIFLKGGLIEAAMLVVGVSYLVASCHLWVSWGLLPRLFPPIIDWLQVRKLAWFGGSVVLMNLAGLLLSNAEKVLLTYFNSVKELAYYSVAFALANLLTIPMQVLAQTMLPVFASLQSVGKQAELQQLYQNILRGILLGVPLLIWAVCLGAKFFFIFWAGPAYGEHSTWPFYILVVGIYCNISTYLPYDLFVAFGEANFNVRYHLWELLPYMLLASWLTWQWGIFGAAIAWSARVTIALPLYLIFVWRRFALTCGLSGPLVFRQLVALLFLSGPFLLSLKFTGVWHWGILLNLLGAATYLKFVWFALLNQAEKEHLRVEVRATAKRWLVNFNDA